MEYVIKRQTKERTTVVFYGNEYLNLYRWGEDNQEKWYETNGMSSDTFLIVEKWLIENGYQDVKFYEEQLR